MSRSYSIPRTATFAWSRGSESTRGTPLLATGTASGALDESFSSGAALELWDAFGDGDEESRVKGRVSVTSKFNCLSWNTPSDGRPEGVLAAGMDNGELALWDPAKIIAGATEEASIFKTDRHKGTVRGLDWNTLQPSLFASGATDAEIFIWDTKNLTKPYGPSANKSRHLTDITALAWNPSVAHILATASASGSTVIWDLKGRQEVIHLSYLGTQGSVYSQGPKPVSSVCWHAERGTRVITSSEDDSAPVVLVWDLRNYRTPERILTGHEKGVLSLDWCKEDPDLLFSCGKDCRTIAWNPSTGEMVGELPVTNNWSFKTASCPRNPGYVATASFDGKIGLSSLQSTNQSTTNEDVQAQTSSDNAADIFSASNISSLAAQVHPGMSLKQPPRWLKRPVSTSFGFGGKLVTMHSHEAPATGAQAQAGPSQSIKIYQVTTESDIVERALLLDGAQDSHALAEFCEQKKNKLSSAEKDAKTSEDELSSWKLLSSLFHANSKDELVTLLGFSKEEVQRKVEEAVKSFKASTDRPSELPLGFGNRKAPSTDSGEPEDGGSVAREPLVTFADQREQASGATDALSASSEGEGAAAKDANASSGNLDTTPSETEASASVLSDATTKIGGAESELTEPSLFGDDAPTNNAQQQAATDFYTSLSSGGSNDRPSGVTDRFALSQANVERAGSSVAATMGSRPSSVASENLKPTTFRIYPQDESEADRLLTRALVLGDFDSAVSLCLSADRFADALLLAVRGGADLLAKTQKAYFERRTSTLPYLRLYQSIVSDDLTDVVQNADLGDWQEIFVVLCTFAKPDEYATLIEQLGQRLEYQFAVAKSSAGTDAVSAAALDQRRSAVLCYLAAGRLEKVVGIWKDEMKEEEAQLASENGGDKSASAQYSAHARALQSFIEKVTVFKSATGYVDVDLAHPTVSNEVAETGARTYKLAALYDKYDEYAEVLSTQGLVTLAVKYAALTPADHRPGNDGMSTRERLQVALGKPIKAPTASQQQPSSTARSAYQPVASTSASVPAPYQPVQQQLQQQVQQQQQQAPQQAAYDDPYRPSGTQVNQPAYQPQQNQYAPSSGYTPSSNYAPATNGYSADPYNPASFVPQPPAPITSPPIFQSSSQPESVAPPPAKKKDVGGWNDAPVVAGKRPGSAASHRATPKIPIMSPFPGGVAAPTGYGPPSGYPGTSPAGPGAGSNMIPPPPPSRSATGSVPPPPPRGQAAATRPPPQQFQQQPQNGLRSPPGMQQGGQPMQMMQGQPMPTMQGQPMQQGGGPGMMQGMMQQPPPMGMMPPQGGMPGPNRLAPPTQPGMQPPYGQYAPPPGQQQQPQQNFVPPPPPRQR